MSVMEQIVRRYLDMDYPVLVSRDAGTKAFVLEVPDWPGCIAHGATIEEAFRSLDDAKFTWVEDCLERGLDIPLPRPREEYSGKFVLRIARSLHRRLAQLAEAESTSLNTYVATVLAEHVGLNKGMTLLTSVRDELRTCLLNLGQYADNVTASVTTRTPASARVEDLYAQTQVLFRSSKKKRADDPLELTESGFRVTTGGNELYPMNFFARHR